MVTSLRSLAPIALALVSCLTVVGCAAEPATRGETPVADDKTAPPVKASTSSNDDGDSDGTLPVTPVGTETDVADRLPPAQGGDEAAKPPKDPAGTTPSAAFETKVCRSEKDGHVSVANITFSKADGVMKITKMTFLVTNKDQQDKNDADIFLTEKGGSEEKVFWTKDILASGKTVEVTDQAKGITPKAGSVLRIETNFDRNLLTDPHADCTVNF